MHKCVSDVVLWLFLSKNRKIQKAKDHIIYLEWCVLWVEAKKKKPRKISDAGILKISSKVPWQMGASLIFALTINSSAGFVYFEETFHLFFQDMRCE